MTVDFSIIKKLATTTGVGVTAAKKALVEVKGDFDKAVESMRKKGITNADSKSMRETRSGVVESYVHDNRIGVLVEINCETDFVAKTKAFKDFAHNVAIHICAATPLYIDVDDIPSRVIEKEKKIEREALKKENKSAKFTENILNSKMDKYFKQVCLLKQPYIKKPEISIDEYRKENIAKLGENIVIKNMARVELGQE
jgi:elongation factor Ts